MSIGVIEEIVSRSLLKFTGKGIYSGIQWASAKAICEIDDADWATPPGLVKIINFIGYGGIGGCFCLWFGGEPLRPMVVFYSGIEFGGYVVPVADNIDDFIGKYRELSKTKSLRGLKTSNEYRAMCQKLIPSCESREIDSELCRSCIFTKFYSGDYSYNISLSYHRRLLDGYFKGDASGSPRIRESFRDADSVLDYRAWIGYLFSSEKHLREGEDICLLENAYSAYRLGPGSGVKGESLYLNRNFYRDLSNQFGFHKFTDVAKEIIQKKCLNYEIRANNYLTKLKDEYPEGYIDIVRRGLNT
jgi:glycosyltransferase involved in cell wall biosynthesis